MGNRFSTTNDYKLSKPMTKSHPVTEPLETKSPAFTFANPADLSSERREQIKDALLSPVTKDVDHMMGKHNNDIGLDAPKLCDPPLSIVSRSNSKTISRSDSRCNSLLCFSSKQNSAARLATTADSKLPLSSSNVDISNTIRLLKEIKKNASPEELVALQRVLDISEERAVPVTEPSVSRGTPVMEKPSSPSLTHRQSPLQKSGVGTRSSPVETRRRTWSSWRTPKLEPEHEAKRPSSSRADSQLALFSAISSTGTTQDTANCRVPTPSELDYSHLGNLRLGSLVVTNGPASPASSFKASNPHLVDHDDYSSETENGSSPLMMKSTRRRGLPKSQSASPQATSSLSTVETIDVPKYHVDEAPKSCKSKSGPPSTKSLSKQSNHRSHHSLRIVDSSSDDQEEPARNYQENIPLGPSPVSVEDRTANKDEGFISDETHYPRSEDSGMCQELVFVQAAPQVVVKNSASSTSIRQTMHKTKSRPNQRPSPRPTDSGYSSGSSLRVVHLEKQEPSPPSTCSHCNCQQTIDPVSSARAILNVRSPGMAGTLVQPNLVTVQSARSVRLKASPQTYVDSPRSSARPSDSEAARPPQTAQSVSSKSSLDNKSGKPQKRLHRRRPSQAEILVVQSCQPIPEGKIPEVPVKVQARLERRVSSSRGMDRLPNMHPTTNHVLMEDLQPDMLLTADGEYEPLTKLQAELPPGPSVQSHRRSFPMYRKNSMTENEAEEPWIEAGYLKHIAASIGTSPYDAAATPKQPKQTASSQTHPHRLGVYVPRAKSMVNMDSKTVSEFERAHRRDVAVSEHMLLQPRRKSFHGPQVNAGATRAPKHRPQSFQSLPVQVIDESKFSRPHSAKPPFKRHSTATCGPSISSGAPAHLRRPTADPISSKSSLSLYQPSQHSVEWDTYCKVRSQRRKTIGEGMRSLDAVAMTAKKCALAESRDQGQEAQNAVLWGRYSGGLGYNYEGRDVGVGGSAGTRQLHSNASVKSLHFKNHYGVDLSDVPIMLKRI